MTIKAVIFDFGNVLVEWHPKRYYDARIGAKRREDFFGAVPIEAMNLAVDRGADMAESVAALAVAYPDWSDEIWLWHDGWLEMASPAIPHSVSMLRALRKTGMPCFALTNFGNATLDIADGAYPFLTEFEYRFVSARLGFLKPEAEIYEAVERGTGLSGDALFFIDDRPENIEAARARGWHGHIFEGAAGLAARLVEEGLLSAEDAAP